MPRQTRRPRKARADAVHTGIRVGLRAVPLIGGLASELFQTIIAPPLEKRREEWMEWIDKSVRELQTGRGLKVDDLLSNDAFIDTVVQATQIAMRTSHSETRAALRNAILNSALPSSIDESLQHMFIEFIDAFIIWHLKILKLFADPSDWYAKAGRKYPGMAPSAIYEFIEATFPELKGRRSFYEQVWRDLYTRGLVNSESLSSVAMDQAFLARKPSEMGIQFLEFVAEPQPKS